MGPLIKMIWVVGFAIFAILVLEIVLFIGVKQERQAYVRTHRSEVTH